MEKKLFRRQLCLVLALCMCFSTMFFYQERRTKVYAAGVDTLISVAQGEVGTSGVPNKYTKWLGTINGNYNYAWCHAFVSWCANQAGLGDCIPRTASCATGVSWFSQRGRFHTRTSGYTPQKGDIIYFGANGGSHVGIVTSVSNGRVYTIEGNARNTVKVNGGYSNGYSLSDTNIYGYGNPVGVPPCSCNTSYAGKYTVTTNSLPLTMRSGHGTNYSIITNIPKGTVVDVSKADGTWAHVSWNGQSGYSSMQYLTKVQESHNPEGVIDSASGGLGYFEVAGWVFDRDNLAESVSVHVYVGGPAGESNECHIITANLARPDVGSAYPGVGNNHGYGARIQTGKSGKQKIYVYAINIGGGGNPLLGVKEVNIEQDTQAPTIQNVKVTNVSTSGYTVECDVSDNTGIDRVQFPTWTAKNGQDDLNANWTTAPECSGTINNGHVTYRVNTSDHNNEPGEYSTHIYAYDKYGNVSSVPVSNSVIVPEPDTEKPVIKNVKITNLSPTGYTVECDVTDNKGIDRVQFPTWTVNNWQDDLVEQWDTNNAVRGTLQNGHATFRVNISDHNNERGLYDTHIYAYDTSGNRVCCEVNEIRVPEVLNVTLSAKNTNPSANTVDRLTANATGGSGNYTYTYKISANGTELVLASDIKSNIYDWNVSKAGTKKLTVIVKDSNGNTAAASKTITVVNNLSVKLAAEKTTAGTNTINKLTATATGGSGTYTYTYKVNVNGREAVLVSNQKSNVYNWNTSKAGTKKLTVIVKDSKGNTATASRDIRVVNSLSVKLTTKNTTVNSNTVNKLTATATGGSGTGYKYTFKVKVGNKSMVLANGQTSREYSWNSSKAGTKTLEVTVTDSNGAKATSSINVNVVNPAAAPLSVKLVAEKTTVTAKTVDKLTATATGGSGNYKYTYMIINNQTGKSATLASNQIGNIYNWNSSAAGLKTLIVTVTDSKGNVATSSTVITVK